MGGGVGCTVVEAAEADDVMVTAPQLFGDALNGPGEHHVGRESVEDSHSLPSQSNRKDGGRETCRDHSCER